MDTNENSFFRSSKTRKNLEQNTEAALASKIISSDTGSSSSCLISLTTNAGEVDPDNILKSSRMEIYCASEDKYFADFLRQRTLPNEVSSPVRKENSNIRYVSQPHMLVSDHEVAGLGYTLSPEPGVLSQTNALDAVNNFLLDNDLGSSQEMHTGKRIGSKSPSVSNLKGVQYLAKWADHHSLAGHTPIFDWVENIDYERGELSNNTKGGFSERRFDALKLSGQLGKQRHFNSAITRAAVAMNEDENAKFFLINANSFNASSCENLPGSEPHENKTLQSDAYGHSNSETLEHQLNETDSYEGIPGTYDVGPATQMAAEAMEALCNRPSVNHEMKKGTDQANEHLIGDSSRDMTVEGNLGDALFSERASSAHDLRIITKQSKWGKMECNKLSRGRSHSSRKQFRNSRMKLLEDTTGETPAGDIFLPVGPKRQCFRKQLVKPARNIFSQSELLGIVQMQEKESKTNSLTEVSFNHPKRRRTHHNTCQNLNVVDSFKRPSLSANAEPATTSHFSSRGIKAIIKGFPEIVDTVKRKKRSMRTYLPAQANNFHFNTKKWSSLSGFGQKSSPYTFPSKSFSGNKLENVLIRSAFVQADSLSFNRHTEAFKEASLIKQDADISLHRDDMVEIPQTGKPKRMDHLSGVGCRLPRKEAEKLLPHLKANYHQAISQNKDSIGSSFASEYCILETNYAFSTPISKDLRRRKYLADVRVMFSQHLDSNTLKRQRKILARLALPIASTIADATHFVADKFSRTRNMLEAIALGKPVVTHMWLESCGQANCFIDEKNYILRDLKKERQFCFSMPISLAHACQYPLLQDRRVFVTPNTKPDQELLLNLVKASSGQAMEMIEVSAINDKELLEILIISCEEDYAICQPLLDKGAKVFKSELLLTGIVTQKLEYESNSLFTNHADKIPRAYR
ncbi:hypothetical protein J5N97_013155 [Dioscorea zingiberensis]|uniref:BRCT domain-containing protein n=1 Tax=Dioscorea zingiberensis TaxID=325984 RepID=A0A9D5CQA0_9LILI|nr:hypothetical protein J5N97_013155 [Dioscorea zingiberensis]